MRIQGAQLTAAKVSSLKKSGKRAKFTRHFKADFSFGNVQVRSLRGQPAIPAIG
jgi:hypothetical protein